MLHERRIEKAYRRLGALVPVRMDPLGYVDVLAFHRPSLLAYHSHADSCAFSITVIRLCVELSNDGVCSHSHTWYRFTRGGWWWPVGLFRTRGEGVAQRMQRLTCSCLSRYPSAQARTFFDHIGTGASGDDAAGGGNTPLEMSLRRIGISPLSFD
jgi:hypothetical protein